MSQTFNITITETLSRTIKIKAETPTSVLIQIVPVFDNY